MFTVRPWKTHEDLSAPQFPQFHITDLKVHPYLPGSLCINQLVFGRVFQEEKCFPNVKHNHSWILILWATHLWKLFKEHAASEHIYRSKWTHFLSKGYLFVNFWQVDVSAYTPNGCKSQSDSDWGKPINVSASPEKKIFPFIGKGQVYLGGSVFSTVPRMCILGEASFSFIIFIFLKNGTKIKKSSNVLKWWIFFHLDLAFFIKNAFWQQCVFQLESFPHEKSQTTITNAATVTFMWDTGQFHD